MVPSDDESRIPRADVVAHAAELVIATCDDAGVPPLPLSAGAVLALEHRPWTRRELEHAMKGAVARARAEKLIERRHLFDACTNLHEATLAFQEAFVRDALVRNKWKVARAARELGLHRSQIYQLLTKLGIKRPSRAR